MPSAFFLFSCPVLQSFFLELITLFKLSLQSPAKVLSLEWDQVSQGMKVPMRKPSLHNFRLLAYCYAMQKKKVRDWTGFELCLLQMTSGSSCREHIFSNKTKILPKSLDMTNYLAYNLQVILSTLYNDNIWIVLVSCIS